jgi:hypothetical protein
MWLGIAFFSIFIIAGFIIFINGASNRFHWAEVEGEITAFTESFRWTSEHHDDGPSQVYYVPQVTYTVKNKKYAGSPKYNSAWRSPDFSRKPTILYDPKDPENFYLKDSDMLKGCFILAMGIIAIVIILIYNL